MMIYYYTLCFTDGKKTSSFDEIIQRIGAFGVWQGYIFITISLPDIWCAFSVMSTVFIGAVPEWNCTMYDDGTKVNYTNYTGPVNQCKGQSDDSRCHEFIYGSEYTSIVSELSCYSLCAEYHDIC